MTGLCIGVRRSREWAGDVDARLAAGLDSRLVMALLRAGGVQATYYTTGNDDSPDVTAARQLARLTGVTHVVRPMPTQQVVDSWAVGSRRAVVQNDGMVSLLQVGDTIDSGRRPMVVYWGIGSEIGRAFHTRLEYFLPQSGESLLTRFIATRARRGHGLLTGDGVAVGRRAVREFIDDALSWGFDPIYIPDLFYTFERVRRWAGANARLPRTTMFSCRSRTRASLPPRSLPPIARYSEPLHFGLLRRLAPELHAYRVRHGGWRTQVRYFNFAEATVRKFRQPAAAADGWHTRTEWLESIRANVAAQFLDRSSSPLWRSSTASFASVMLDTDAVDALTVRHGHPVRDPPCSSTSNSARCRTRRPRHPRIGNPAAPCSTSRSRPPSEGVAMAGVVNVNELLDSHVVLDLSCLDRIYLNAYVPKLQTPGQVVWFMKEHLGMPIPSPAMMSKIGDRFRKAVARFRGGQQHSGGAVQQG